MAVELTVPALGESITEAVVGKWHKKVGDTVAADEPVVVLETDKVTIDVPAPAAGTLAAIAHGEGDTVKIGDVLGSIAPAPGQRRPPRRRSRPHRHPSPPRLLRRLPPLRAPARPGGAGRALSRCRAPGSDDAGGARASPTRTAGPGHVARARRVRTGDEGRRADRPRGSGAAAPPRPGSGPGRRGSSAPAPSACPNAGPAKSG